jgi:carbon storage regulator
MATYPVPRKVFSALSSKEELPVLIITRRPGERIMLGDDTTIHIMEIVGNNVRVGVEAPKSIPVYREEIWTAVKEENRAAAAAEQTKLPRPAARA